MKDPSLTKEEKEQLAKGESAYLAAAEGPPPPPPPVKDVLKRCEFI